MKMFEITDKHMFDQFWIVDHQSRPEEEPNTKISVMFVLPVDLTNFFADVLCHVALLQVSEYKTRRSTARDISLGPVPEFMLIEEIQSSYQT
jgi:hypothetical protein